MNIADKINGTAEYGLRAQTTVRGIDAAVAENTNIVHAAIRFYKIVRHEENIVVIEVDRNAFPFRSFFRNSISTNAYSVMEIGYIVVAHNMSLPVDFDRIVRVNLLWFTDFKPASCPAMNTVTVMTANKYIVGYIEIL